MSRLGAAVGGGVISRQAGAAGRARIGAGPKEYQLRFGNVLCPGRFPEVIDQSEDVTGDLAGQSGAKQGVNEGIARSVGCNQRVVQVGRDMIAEASSNT